MWVNAGDSPICPFSPDSTFKLIRPEEEAGTAIGRDRGVRTGNFRLGIILTRGRWNFGLSLSYLWTLVVLCSPPPAQTNCRQIARAAQAQASAHRARRSPMPGDPNHHPNSLLEDPRILRNSCHSFAIERQSLKILIVQTTRFCVIDSVFICCQLPIFQIVY